MTDMFLPDSHGVQGRRVRPSAFEIEQNDVVVEMGTTTGLEEVRLADADPATVARFHVLLESAFPPAELMTLDELEEARHDGATSGLLLVDGGGEPVAGMVSEDYVDGRVVLLAYLVVSASARSGGLGARLLRRLLEPDGRPEPPLVMAEIEDPRFHPSSDFGDPVARVRFYDRAGARLLPLDYAQPSLRPGSPRVGELLLITLGADGPDVDGRLVAEFLEEYYATCEGDEIGGDAAFRALRRAALGDERGRVRLHPLASLDLARPGPL